MHHPTEPEHIAPLSQHKLSSKEENRQVFRNREKITSVDKNMKVNTELCVGIIDVLKGRCDIKWQKQNGDKQAACQWADGCDSLMSCSDVLNMLLSVNYIYWQQMNKAQVTKHLLNKTFLTNTFSTTESNSQLPLWTEQNQAGRPCRTRPPDVGSENKPAVSKWLFFIYSGFILMSFKELLF